MIKKENEDYKIKINELENKIKKLELIIKEKDNKINELENKKEFKNISNNKIILIILVIFINIFLTMIIMI